MSLPLDTIAGIVFLVGVSGLMACFHFAVGAIHVPRAFWVVSGLTTVLGGGTFAAILEGFIRT